MSEQTTSTVARRMFTTEQLRSIKSFDDLGSLIKETGTDVVNAAELIGDGFELIKDKDSLVGVPFVIVDFQFTTSKDRTDPETGEPTQFVTARLVTETNRKLIINDGSTGIRDQLRSVGEIGGAVLYVPRGLRVSEYQVEIVGKNGKTHTEPAKTYYLSV